MGQCLAKDYTNKYAIKIAFNNKKKTKTLDPNIYDEEDKNEYCKGGYCPIKIDDVLHERFKITRKLGWGSFSTVWLCSDLRSQNDLVALKVIKSCESRGASNEIRNLLTVKNNDRIVRLLHNCDIVSRNGIHTCLAFEALGESMFDLIKKSNYKGMPMQNVKTITKQVLEGLDYLHTSCKLIHTDIKPENILVCADEGLPDLVHKVCSFSVKIADLGCAVQTKGNCFETIQSRPYRSPEVILHAGFGTSADIWSFACSAFELATGHYLINPQSCGDYSTNLHHLALMINLLGEIPQDVALAGVSSVRYFTRTGMFRCIALLRPRGLVKKLVKQHKWGKSAADKFSKFLLPMLDYDQNKRVSAEVCMKHEWLRDRF